MQRLRRVSAMWSDLQADLRIVLIVLGVLPISCVLVWIATILTFIFFILLIFRS